MAIIQLNIQASNPQGVTCPALTSPYGQKDISACELVASAAGSNICTLTQGLILYILTPSIVKGLEFRPIV